jgi:hypothetical protein
MNEKLNTLADTVSQAFPEADTYWVSLIAHNLNGPREAGYHATVFINSKALSSGICDSIDGLLFALKREVDKHNLAEKFRREFNERYAQAITSEVLP